MDERTAKKLRAFRALMPENPPESMAPAGRGLNHTLLWTLVIGSDLLALLLFSRAIGRFDLPKGPSLLALLLLGGLIPWIVSLALWGLGLYRTVWLGWNSNHVIVLDPGLLRPTAARVDLFQRQGLALRWINKGSLELEQGGLRVIVHLDRPAIDGPRIEQALAERVPLS